MDNNHIFEEKIVDYILGNLSSEEHFSVTSHLKRCRKCADNFQLWQNLLADESVQIPSETAKKEILAKTKKWNFNKRPIYALSLCVVVVVFLIGTLINDFSNKEIAINQENSAHNEEEIVTEENFINLYPNVSTMNYVTDKNWPKGITRTSSSNPISMLYAQETFVYHLHPLIIFQKGPVCIYSERWQRLICYKYNPMTNEYYPIDKIK